MILLVLSRGSELVKIKIEGKALTFTTSDFGQPVTIDKLYLSKDGCIKEFPDLVNDEDWRNKSIQRFKQKMERMKTEEEIVDYLIKDLSPMGYLPIYKQKKGFRANKLDGAPWYYYNSSSTYIYSTYVME